MATARQLREGFVAGLRTQSRRYHAGPSRFGRYDVLQASSAMTAYPDPRLVPDHISRPAYVPRNFFDAPWGEHDPVEEQPIIEQEEGRIKLGTDEEQRVRRSGKAVAQILTQVEKLLVPGMTTNDTDKAVHELIVGREGYPSPLGYSNFPRSCTTSVNNVVAHGIPDDRPLLPDDIINVDLTIFLDGYHGDTSTTFALPGTDKAGRDLISATKEALELAIRACGPGRHLSDIGRTIEEFAKRHKFSINDQFSGHGIGRNFHQKPWIIHSRNHEQGKMMPGDCFTIEPILVQGSDARGEMWDDGWTMSTRSGARAAQAEHQILITEDGVDVLTRRPNEQT